MLEGQEEAQSERECREPETRNDSQSIERRNMRGCVVSQPSQTEEGGGKDTHAGKADIGIKTGEIRARPGALSKNEVNDQAVWWSGEKKSR